MVSGGDVGFVREATVKLIPTNLLSMHLQHFAIKGKCGKRRFDNSDILMTHIMCLWLECGSCFRYYIQSGSRSQCTARHNDARLRTIKLTQNYIDDIF